MRWGEKGEKGWSGGKRLIWKEGFVVSSYKYIHIKWAYLTSTHYSLSLIHWYTVWIGTPADKVCAWKAFWYLRVRPKIIRSLVKNSNVVTLLRFLCGRIFRVVIAQRKLCLSVIDVSTIEVPVFKIFSFKICGKLL